VLLEFVQWEIGNKKGPENEGLVRSLHAFSGRVRSTQSLSGGWAAHSCFGARIYDDVHHGFLVTHYVSVLSTYQVGLKNTRASSEGRWARSVRVKKRGFGRRLLTSGLHVRPAVSFRGRTLPGIQQVARQNAKFRTNDSRGLSEPYLSTGETNTCARSNPRAANATSFPSLNWWSIALSTNRRPRDGVGRARPWRKPISAAPQAPSRNRPTASPAKPPSVAAVQL